MEKRGRCKRILFASRKKEKEEIGGVLRGNSGARNRDSGPRGEKGGELVKIRVKGVVVRTCNEGVGE